MKTSTPSASPASNRINHMTAFLPAGARAMRNLLGAAAFGAGVVGWSGGRGPPPPPVPPPPPPPPVPRPAPPPPAPITEPRAVYEPVVFEMLPATQGADWIAA